ncbi:hypothetical protein [Streptomyces sp. ME19-01-6]|uniref:hypothetical protein n=1 Tax=Streptomyces sp. ME19-01-6 TaxID=3028686 RepID=UPI0029A760FF|nr:hypothetical protein [Streptomyces sp. ME19-01-6]MDX3233904.1 hypothetical protein [Streptomyces sp. ME19-01-6]
MRETRSGRTRLNELSEQAQPAPRLAAVSPPTAERAVPRALWPLQRTSPSLVANEVEEKTTAERAAREGLWLSSCVPVRERWMDMVLVVDRSSSMVAWRRACVARKVVAARHAAYGYSLMGPQRIWVRGTHRALVSVAAG